MCYPALETPGKGRRLSFQGPLEMAAILDVLVALGWLVALHFPMWAVVSAPHPLLPSSDPASTPTQRVSRTSKPTLGHLGPGSSE